MRGFGGDVEALVAAIDEKVAGGDAGVELEAGGGDGAGEALAAVGGDPVHVGDVGGFKGGFVAELGDCVVGGTVGDDDGVFHGQGKDSRRRLPVHGALMT